MNKPHVVLIAGPTGVGKTAASVILAKKLNTDIISCDSMQIYRGMDIGTAKVTQEEAQGVFHHMTDIVSPRENFSVYDYVKGASALVEDLHKKGKISLVVGGTGLYADSLLGGITFEEEAPADPLYRQELMALAEKEGKEYLHAMLSYIDPKSAEKIHPNNVKRVIRALEYYHASGRTISDYNESTRSIEPPYRVDRIYFTRERDSLYQRIDRRVDVMIEQGLEEEVRQLLAEGVSPRCTSMQALGYKEMAEYIHGKISLPEAVELIKSGSRHYAKRQLTWFRRARDAHWLTLEDDTTPEETADMCLEILERSKP